MLQACQQANIGPMFTTDLQQLLNTLEQEKNDLIKTAYGNELLELIKLKEQYHQLVRQRLSGPALDNIIQMVETEKRLLENLSDQNNSRLELTKQLFQLDQKIANTKAELAQSRSQVW